MKNLYYLEAFKFRKKDTFLHRLNIISKLPMLIGFSTLSIIFSGVLSQILLFLVMISLFSSSKLWVELYRLFRGNILLFALIVGMDYIFTRDMYFSVSMGLRLINLTGFFSIFFLTVLPSELSDLMTFLRMPYELIFVFTTSIRFIPVVIDDIRQIMDAQRSRGLELDKGSILERIKKYLPILVPLVVHSIKRSQQLAEAIESRAFGSGVKRTSMYQFKIGILDLTFILICLIIFSLFMYAKFSQFLF